MTVILFDSGMGGLTVARAVGERMAQARLVYVADTGGFPYGAWEEVALAERISTVAGLVVEAERPASFVVACNTASTIALEVLRRRFPVPFIGTVPAVKPAAALTRSGLFSVLATPGTVKREYTRALIETFAFHCRVTLHGAAGLAALAERKMHGNPVDRDALREEIAPAFVAADGKRTDVVVLGCTHYPLLLDEIREVAPWEVAYVDPADAIARRVADVTPETNAAEVPGPGHALVTSPEGLGLADVFVRFGYGETRLLEVDRP